MKRHAWKLSPKDELAGHPPMEVCEVCGLARRKVGPSSWFFFMKGKAPIVSDTIPYACGSPELVVVDQPTFHERFKELRIKHGLGWREFWEGSCIPCERMFAIYNGRVQATEQEVTYIIARFATAGTPLTPADRAQLIELWQQPFTPTESPKDLVPVFVKTVDGKPLSEDKLRRLTDYINR